VLFQVKDILETMAIGPVPISKDLLLTAGKLLGIVAAGGFGGWIYAIVSLLEGGK
jgi:hypothetical protein